MRLARLAVSVLISAMLMNSASFASTDATRAADRLAAENYAVVSVDDHQLEIGSNKTEGTFDGRSFDMLPILIRNQMVYFPVRTLEKLGVAQVDWAAEQRQANIFAVNALRATRKDVGIRERTKLLYNLDGTKLESTVAGSEPFIQQGRMYVPIDLLPLLGITVHYNQGRLTAKWSSKHLELGEARLRTEERTARINILYEKQLAKPVFLKAGANGTATAITGEIIDHDALSEEKSYNRIQYELELDAGLNAYELRLIGEAVFFTIERKADHGQESILKLSAEGQHYLSLHEPRGAASDIRAGDGMIIAGKVASTDPAIRQLQVYISRYNGKSYMLTDSYSLPVRDGEFEYEYTLAKEGDYIVQLVSPPYTLTVGQEPVPVIWAEWKTAVKP
ncbi:stalk domain-containing protein [Paenibacillus sp. GCM10012307]|uniref:Copper amine oxidase-like N-terminal domain-containing protein n=1 Tax=Paenibacillus roseus TaxID=2798579 RepID=A0A934MQC1_9BACL|nr:hypothetical protein [Paenibacillus roseus]MBJ6361239.1 hypothetical protein [Paenibacillus roseus]